VGKVKSHLGETLLIVDTHAHASLYWFEPVETLLYEMSVNSVAKAVLTQIIHIHHNDYFFDCLQRYPGRFAACVVVDATKRDGPDKLKECVERGSTGLRLSIKTGSPDSNQLAVWRKAEELRLAVSVAGSEEAFASDEFRRIVETFPDLAIVIEHCGKPGEDEQTPYPLYSRVLSLARYPNVYMKLGGLGEICKVPAFGGPNPFSNVPPFAKMAVDAFGPRRLMFGSNFPPVTHLEGYRNALSGLMDHLSYLGQEDLQWIFGKTALTVWNFSDENVPCPGITPLRCGTTSEPGLAP
jgi:L-fuconolactonase